MNRLLTALLCFSSLLTAGHCWGADRARIGVLELGGHGTSPEEAKGLTDRLRAELFRTGQFVVVEREKIEEIMKELGFQQSGACNTDRCAVEVGKHAGAQQMVAGSVSKVGQLYSVNLRLIDVEQGVMVGSALRDCSGRIDRVLTETIREVARQLAGLSHRETDRASGRSRLKVAAFAVVGGGAVTAALIAKDRWLGRSKEKPIGTIKIDVPWP